MCCSHTVPVFLATPGCAMVLQELRHSNEQYRGEIGILEQKLQKAENERAQELQALEQEVGRGQGHTSCALRVP